MIILIDAVIRRDVQGEFFNVKFWQIMGVTAERVTYAREIVDSDDFEKGDAEKLGKELYGGTCGKEIHY